MTVPVYPRPGTRLTRRERDVLTALARGHSIRSAAESLGMATETVKSLSRRARRRLGAAHTAHAVALAIGTGQLPAGIAVPDGGESR